MNNIRVENLRCFKDTGKINILPLNIAVGKNSCGKSTILRIFPLLKQTVEAKTSEPILWYGRYVDFGDFKKSLNNTSENDEITFTFNFNTRVRNKKDVEIYLLFKIKKNYISFLNIKLLQDNIEIEFSENGNVERLIINSEKFEVENDKIRELDTGIIPTIKNSKIKNKYLYNDIFLFEENESMYISKDVRNKLNEIIKDDIENKDMFIKCIYKYFIERLPDKDDFEKNFEKNIEAIISYTNEDRIMYMEKSPNHKKNIPMKKYKDRISIIKTDIRNNYELLYNNALSENLNNIINRCNMYLFYYFNNVSYIAPIRAMAERYYRVQGLAIDDVDSRGENVPMILKNMNENERKMFDKWMINKFGFCVKTVSTEGHVSLIINNNGKEINIADTGFGYSQMLPIIILLWQSKNNKNNFFMRKTKKLIVIEQPELHLHPKMQAQLIDAILEVVKETEQINFFIETHSQTIIDCIGCRIEDKKIGKEKVNVMLIEQDENQVSNIRNVKYSKEGYLQEWPIDFFVGDEY